MRPFDLFARSLDSPGVRVPGRVRRVGSLRFACFARAGLRALVLCLLASALLLPPTAEARRHHRSQDDSQPATSASADGFDFYVLSLSWSPSYCQLRPGDRDQCGNRRFGFVLHGLWPQYQSGGYPDNCLADRPVPGALVQRMLPIMPSTRLIAHEWSKHGSCTGLSPEQYFGAAERAYGAVRPAPLFEAERPPQSLGAGEIIAAIRAANPQVPPDGIALKCRGPELEEVRLCVSKDLAPMSCGRAVRTQCRGGPIQIRPVR